MTTMEEDILNGKLILVVDDEADLRDIVASELEFMGAKVQQAANVESAIDFLKQSKVDLVVSDIRMPGASGIDLLKHVKSSNVDAPPMILITGFADITPQTAFSSGAEAILSKPFKLEELVHYAYRLTSPMKDRFKEKTVPHSSLERKFEQSFADKIARKEIALGRGGINVLVDLPCAKCELGEVMRFRFTFSDSVLTGTAVCRWWSSQEKSNLASVGLEFIQLSEESYQLLSKYWENDKLVPFIPSLA